MSIKKSRMEAEKKAKAERIWNFECAITIDGTGERRAAYSSTMGQALAMFKFDMSLPAISKMVLFREGRAIRRYDRAEEPLAQTPSP